MRSRVACLALGAVALTAGVVTGCGGDDSSSDSSAAPEDVVQQFIDSSKDGDGAAVCDLLSSESQTQVVEDAKDADDCEGAFDEDPTASDVPDDLEVGDATIDGDTGTVAITVSGQESTIPVVQEDGEWKIDIAGGGA
jgi:Domain of unknown function (DUF4878)